MTVITPSNFAAKTRHFFLLSGQCPEKVARLEPFIKVFFVVLQTGHQLQALDFLIDPCFFVTETAALALGAMSVIDAGNKGHARIDGVDRWSNS